MQGIPFEATHGYIFIRGEYIEAAQYLNEALEQTAKGYLGENILGTGWNFEMHVHTGAGVISICGEETALINSLERRRANPRTKPPFPQVAGAWGRPTIVNNVETYNNLPAIMFVVQSGISTCLRVNRKIQAPRFMVHQAKLNSLV